MNPHIQYGTKFNETEEQDLTETAEQYEITAQILNRPPTPEEVRRFFRE